MNFVHLKLLVVCNDIENYVNVLTGFQRYRLKMVQIKLCHHQLPSTTIYHHPQPAKIYPPLPTTSRNISSSTHQLHPPAANTNQNISTTIPHHPPTAKTFFIKNLFIRISSHYQTTTQET